MVSNEAIVTFREMGDRRPKDDSICDLVQQRWLNHHTLNQSWTNIYCYVHPATVYDCSAMEVKYIKFIDFDRHLAFLDDSELICSLSSASYKSTDEERLLFVARLGDHIVVPQQQIGVDKIVNEIRPVHVERKTGTVTFWDRKRECGRINGNITFNISDCDTWTPRPNDEVSYRLIF